MSGDAPFMRNVMKGTAEAIIDPKETYFDTAITRTQIKKVMSATSGSRAKSPPKKLDTPLPPFNLR